MGVRLINGKWHVDYRVNGKRMIRSVGAGAGAKKRANILWAKIQADVFEGRYFDKHDRPKTSFGTLVAEYLESARERKRTWRDDERRVRALLAHFGAETQAVEISRPDVERFKHEQKARPTCHNKKRAPATVNRDLALLKRIFNWARETGRLDHNPVTGVKMFAEKNVRDRVVTLEELERLLQALPEHYRPITIVAHETGMRQGELLGLTWDRVDLKKGFVRLRPQDTKTEEGRVVPLTERAILVLSEAPRKQGCLAVFQVRGKPLRFHHSTFRTARDQAGLKDVVFHSLRHTFVTNARRAGIPDVVIMKITGHKTDSVFRRYNTVDHNDLKAAAARLHRAQAGLVAVSKDNEEASRDDSNVSTAIER